MQRRCNNKIISGPEVAEKKENQKTGKCSWKIATACTNLRPAFGGAERQQPATTTGGRLGAAFKP